MRWLLELHSHAIANWASKTSDGSATITKPPNTEYFECKQCKLPPLTRTSRSSDVPSAMPIPSAALAPSTVLVPSALVSPETPVLSATHIPPAAPGPSAERVPSTEHVPSTKRVLSAAACIIWSQGSES
ncbi:hypothetical protein BDP27DRAFT_525453 [Rhodocollybia butyracea]|uniref:Uncharacterized protein n=1 Tax=Rhodocollybia butyracea TaxID=206335 RepID=A0A9P5U8T5_9AGAR|nr:hypothetical protein BDP27DRAFT_525453 [Rhodocollybia butyracea]